ncbi:rho guanine nucleotide exchange factor 11 [Battus philenor]|uniref:rho guanine nucleotide exchange factor 11 n=1 Tax=Battus philenor TaxID=42288 RepID=UPI0035D080FC
MLGGAGDAGGGELLTVTVARDEHGYGMKVSGDNPVYVQSVKEQGAAWRAGLRAGDRILCVDSVHVYQHTHQQVVHMIRAKPTTVLTVQQNSSRNKTPITAPLPVNPENQRQLEESKMLTMKLMLQKEQKYIRELRNELQKVPDVRKQAQLDAALQRCSKLQHEIDTVMAAQGESASSSQAPGTPRAGFLSGLPRSLSNLTGQSLRNLRQARARNDAPLTPLTPLSPLTSPLAPSHIHTNTVPLVPTTCLDNAPPPLPPRSTERPKRSPPHAKRPPQKEQLQQLQQMHPLRRSSHSLDGELDGPQPNSIALQMSYPLVNVPPPPLQTDNRGALPILHARSQSSPEHLDHELPRPCVDQNSCPERAWEPPGTPPPPYAHNTQPCVDPQRAIISMEEDDPPTSVNSSCSGLFSNLRSVRDSRARMAVLLNWLIGERRCPCAWLVLVLTEQFRTAAVPTPTLRRWAYEIHSSFLMPHAVLQLNGVDEQMAIEIDHVLLNEYQKEELLRNVFRKARQKAKEELAAQLSEFQLKRQVGLGTLYGPDDAVLDKCDVDKAQEQVVVERLMYDVVRTVAGGPALGCCGAQSAPAHRALHAALVAAALCLDCRPAAVAAAATGARESFLQRDKLYKQRLKHIAKQRPQPYVVRGHQLQLQALTSVAHCHHCDLVIWGLAPQAYVCANCKLHVHRECAKSVEEGCVLDSEHHNNRISRFMERIHHNNQPGQDASDKKSRKASTTGHFLNMERSFRKNEDEATWEQTLIPSPAIGESKREGSAEEPSAPEAEPESADTAPREPDREHSRRTGGGGGTGAGGRAVNRAESCRERDAPRRGKHRNASDPNRLTAHHNHDLEPGAATAPSGSSSSSSLSSRSNESNTVAAEQQASQSDWSEEEEPLAAQWADNLPPQLLDSLLLPARLRKRQEVIHELIVSEGSHVRWLKVLDGVFHRPLLGQPSLLPAEELRALFPNLPGVRERHAKLYAELRAARNDAPGHVVQVRPVADALLNTLGESGYASCLARFCRGQRMALEALRERRRKHKELHQFLCSREQLPLCGRLQLRDLLACVWQRLTKYQLLLEGVLKTVSEAEGDSAEDALAVRRALIVAKDVLHSVDTAIRSAENEHRLKTIQSKLEVRAGAGAEWDELRRLDLTSRSLRLEGELGLRNDSKRLNVLALMLDDCLVLLQREGDKFVLKPINQPSQQGQLSPLIKWDKVLFRPNAAVRNTFFLMNINGVQMHELSANTPNEYTTWVKHIQQAPLAKLTELKPALASHQHHHSRSIDDSGINVSRNPSDASEKSSSTAPDEEREREHDREQAAEQAPENGPEHVPEQAPERERNSAERIEHHREDKREEMTREGDSDDSHRQQRATVGRISMHSGDCAPALTPPNALTVAEPGAVHTARRALTHQERLRRLDEVISRALRAKSSIVGELLGVPADSYAHLADMAVADTLGQVDMSEMEPTESDEVDIHQLLLAAHEQANQLTEMLSRALTLDESGAVAARSGRCDNCRRAPRPQESPEAAADRSDEISELENCLRASEELVESADDSYDLLPDLARPVPLVDCEPPFEGSQAAGAARLARRLGGPARALSSALSRLLAHTPPQLARAHAARGLLAAQRDAADALRAALAHHPHHAHHPDYQMTDDITFPKAVDVDRSMQDQPSNGG